MVALMVGREAGVDERPLVDGASAGEAHLGLEHVVLADRDQRELAGHRLGLVPHPRAPTRRDRLTTPARRWTRPRGLRHVHREGVGRLVLRRVVVGEAGHRADRLAEERRAVRGRASSPDGAVGVDVGGRDAVVVDDHGERVRHRVGRRHDQLPLSGAAPCRSGRPRCRAKPAGSPLTVTDVDREPLEVEAERRQRRDGGGRRDRRGRVDRRLGSWARPGSTRCRRRSG